LIRGEHDALHVGDARRIRVVHDGKIDIGILLRHLRGGVAQQEAHGNDQVIVLLGKLGDILLVVSLRLAFDELAANPKFFLSVLHALPGVLVKAGVVNPTDVRHHSHLQSAPLGGCSRLCRGSGAAGRRHHRQNHQQRDRRQCPLLHTFPPLEAFICRHLSCVGSAKVGSSRPIDHPLPFESVCRPLECGIDLHGHRRPGSLRIPLCPLRGRQILSHAARDRKHGRRIGRYCPRCGFDKSQTSSADQALVPSRTTA
jgi:hypothetical protein